MVIHEKHFNKNGCPYCGYRGIRSTMRKKGDRAHAIKKYICPKCSSEFIIVANPDECIYNYVKNTLKDHILDKHPRPNPSWR